MFINQSNEYFTKIYFYSYTQRKVEPTYLLLSFSQLTWYVHYGFIKTTTFNSSMVIKCSFKMIPVARHVLYYSILFILYTCYFILNYFIFLFIYSHKLFYIILFYFILFILFLYYFILYFSLSLLL